MNFKNRRYVTKGVSQNVGLLLQLFMWQCIDSLSVSQDFLQVFKCSLYDSKQEIVHIQEEPEYTREYLLNTDAPIFVGKIYVIDDEIHSTMLLEEEY